MKHLCITLSISCFLGLSFLYSQTEVQIDSLQKLLSTQKGVEKVKTLDELAWKLRNRKDSTAITYALEALQLSKKENFNIGVSDALNRLGGIAKSQGDISMSKNYYLEALRKDKKNKYRYGVARAYNQLGLIYKREKNRLMALEHFLLGYETFIRDKKYKQASKVAGNIGTLYLSYLAYQEALKYFIKQLEHSELEGDLFLVAKSNKNLGRLHKLQKNYKEALYYFQRAKKIYQQKDFLKEIANMQIEIASIYDYLNEDQKSIETFNNVRKFMKNHQVGNRAAFHHNLATFYRKIEQKDSSLYHYQKGIVIYRKKKDVKRLLVSYNNLGNLYYDFKQYPEALNYLNSSLALQHQYKDSSILEKTYTSISNVYFDVKDHFKAHQFKDSAYMVSKQQFLKIKTADRYEVAYLNEKRKADTIKNQKKIVEANTRQKNTLIIFLVILLVISSVLFFYVTKSRRLKQLQLVSEFEKHIQQKQVQELISNQEMNVINAMINGQEEERKRVAKDLHDRLGSMLSVAKMYYQSVEDELEHINENVQTQYRKANQLLDDACKAVREIAYNMLSGTLAKFGLVSALQELKQTLERASNLQITSTVYNLDDRLDNKMEIQIYRIIQELLNNIIKHAQAKQVDIQLLRNETGINIIVEDDGVGFDVTKKYTGVGLKTVASRITEMKGIYSIDSGKGNGTIISIDIPI